MASIKKNKSVWRYLIWGIIILGALFLIWRFYLRPGGPPAGMGMSVPPVRVAAAITQNVPYYLEGIGTVVPSADVLVRSRVDGQLLKLHFRDGQHVKAGDLLAEIDPRPFKASLDQALGTLQKDKALLQNAKLDLERYAKLAKNDFIAGQQYENQKSLVRQYAGTVESDQAAVDSAKLQLEYSRVTAPIAGRLGLRVVDEGNQVKAGDAEGLVRITETDPCDVIFTLPEKRVNLVAAALKAREKNPALPPLRVEAWDRENRALLAVGQLISLDNQIDSATGTVKLKARFANDKDHLFPNQFVNARLLVQTIQDAITVPAAAVQLGAKGSYCYVVVKEEENGEQIDKAMLRNITPGIITEGVEIIDKGIVTGELVVVDGIDRLRDDLRVRVAATMETPRLADLAPQPAEQ